MFLSEWAEKARWFFFKNDSLGFYNLSKLCQSSSTTDLKYFFLLIIYAISAQIYKFNRMTLKQLYFRIIPYIGFFKVIMQLNSREFSGFAPVPWSDSSSFFFFLVCAFNRNVKFYFHPSPWTGKKWNCCKNAVRLSEGCRESGSWANSQSSERDSSSSNKENSFSSK